MDGVNVLNEILGRESDGSDIEGVDLEEEEEVAEPVNPQEGNISSDDDEDFDGFHPDWVYEDFNPRQPRAYRQDGGATRAFDVDSRPVDYFNAFWGDDLWEHLVLETNRYADQEREKNPPPPHAPKWSDVDVDTMKAFMGLCMAMGILKVPHRNDYWRCRKFLFRTNFNSVMPRDRFNLIWRYLHLNNNEAPRPACPDKLVKVRHLIDYLNTNFMELYRSHGNSTVDETMVKFKGRLSFRQYLPAKPTKWGIKFWTLAEATTGYLERFQVYTGKEAGQEKGLTHRVVTDLTEHLHNTYIHIYMDNFYTSVPLLEELLANGMYGCGTVRANRKGLPTRLLPKNEASINKNTNTDSHRKTRSHTAFGGIPNQCCFFRTSMIRLRLVK